MEPVSSRLKQSLVHPSKKGSLVGLRYSPDGKRIIAGDYPGGVIQVWDAETGKQLTKIETGHGVRSSTEYFCLAPDWSTVYVHRMKRKATRFERDGQKLIRYEFDGDVRAWDLSTGELRETFKHDPPRGINGMRLSPDGSTFATFEMLSTESGQLPETSASLWDVRTKQFRSLAGGLAYWAVYSQDGMTLAAPAQNESGQAIAVKLFDLATAQEKVSIPITEKNVRTGYVAFSPDGHLLVGQVRSLDFKTQEHWLKFWDVASGQEVASFAGERMHVFLFMAFSPDGRTLAVTNSLDIKDSTRNDAKLFLFDLSTKQLISTVNLGDKASAGEPAFSPDGKWLAVRTQVFSMELLRSPEPNPEDAPQPRIHLIDVAAGEVRETLVAPLGFTNSVCFSPDGRTLATGGNGKVLLWDLTKTTRRSSVAR